MTIYNDILDIVQNDCVDYFSKESMTLESFQSLNLLANQMNAWIKEVDKLHLVYETFKSKRKKWWDIDEDKLLPSMRLAKQHDIENIYAEWLENQNNLVDLLKYGYEIIHKFRESFTGQSIIYSITTEVVENNKRKILEISLTLEELLSLVDSVKQAGKDENDFALFIRKNIAARAKVLKKDSIREFTDHQYRMFYSILDVWTQDPDVKVWQNKRLPSIKNRGRVYEVYSKYKDQFAPPFSKKERGRIYNSLLKAQEEHIEGWMQGDYMNKQLKTVFDNSTADLITMEEAKRVISKTLSVLTNSKNDKEKIKNLIKIYTTKGVSKDQIQYIDKDILNDALARIKKSFLDKIK